MSMTSIIENKLRDAFDPRLLDVLDDSASHIGHAGYREGGESHFKVTIRSAAFEGQSRVAQQRAIYKVLADEMKTRIHALEIDAGA